jgi:hydroxyethylthiazole kinase
MIAAGDIAAMIERVRQKRPRVHAIMNSVAQKLVADGLSVLGAIPSMTANSEEIADFIANADALLVNLGTLEGERRDVIRAALSSMRQGGRPAVLDPVFCDVSRPRLAFARELAGSGVTSVRGNKSEMAAIGTTDGVVRIETGPVDTIRLGDRTIRLSNGHPWLAFVSGTGCLSGALIAAFQAVEPDGLMASAAVIATLSIAAEIAAEKADGPGSFAPALLDALYAIDEKTLSDRLRIVE